MIANNKLRAADLFCGAGGMTYGAEQSGRISVVLAVNHWRTAVYSHQDNHPHTRHICARIEDLDIRNEHNMPELDAIFGGIECVHHSNARGAAPINDQRRSSAWRVIDWIERFRPQWCVFENVREFLNWGPIDDHGKRIKSKAGTIFAAWVAAIRAHGYHVEWKILNAAEFGEATRRHRLFIICRRGESTQPFRWPTPTHGTADQIQEQLQTEHRCGLHHERPAADIIDWSLPCPSIFARKKPLADKTLRRIEAGLRKFVGPFVTQYHNGPDGDRRNYSPNEPIRTLDTQPRYALAIPHLVHLRGTATANSVDRPIGTITAGGGHWALAQPFVMQQSYATQADEHRVYSPREPMRVLATKQSYAMVQPFVMQSQGPGWSDPNYLGCFGRDRALPTLLARNNHSVVVPYMLDVNHGGPDARVYDTRGPLNTITTKRGVALTTAYLTKFYGTGGAVSVGNPLDTITTKDRFGLTLVQTMARLGVIDIGFRMLSVDELKQAQGFPTHYILHGNKADQTRQIGNSVCPKVMAAICTNLN